MRFGSMTSSKPPHGHTETLRKRSFKRSIIYSRTAGSYGIFTSGTKTRSNSNYSSFPRSTSRIGPYSFAPPPTALLESLPRQAMMKLLSQPEETELAHAMAGERVVFRMPAVDLPQGVENTRDQHAGDDRDIEFSGPENLEKIEWWKWPVGFFFLCSFIHILIGDGRGSAILVPGRHIYYVCKTAIMIHSFLGVSK